MTSLRTACAAGLLCAGCAAPPSATSARVSGQVEATEVQVAADIGGRIIERRVSEGDVVAAGDLVARLDVRDFELQRQRAVAERAAADAQLRLLLAGAREEEVRQAEAQVKAAEADVATIDADTRAAELDLRRFEALLAARAGSEKQRDDVRARIDVAGERRRGAEERVRAAREALARIERGARSQEIDGARARLAATEASIALLDESLRDAEVVSPVAGVVTDTLADAGELVARGAPIAVVTDLDRAWATLFVPEPLVPRIRLGQAATLHTDAGGTGLGGTVTHISPRAEFTPRNVQTPEERSKLVYRIKVSVDNRGGVLKPGMPVDAELALQ